MSWSLVSVVVCKNPVIILYVRVYTCTLTIKAISGTVSFRYDSGVTLIIIIICRNRHIFKRGWMPHKRETQMVYNLHFPTGTTYFRVFLEFGIEGHFKERKLYQFPGWMKNSPYYCPAGARTHDLPHTQTS